MLKLYDYWRSSAAYRVRIALNLKNASYDSIPVNIAPGKDEQFADKYKHLNPQMRVPSIEQDGRISGQSLAIIEWLSESLPGPSLLPEDEAAVTRWYHDWIRRGFEALERIAQDLPPAELLFGHAPTIAEICLVPQVANARRFDMDLSDFPRLQEVDAACRLIDAFARAAPEAQQKP